jgi:hypothetical protein
MKRARYGKTRTLSISVDPETDRILHEEAKAHFGGNVSKLVGAIAREARRKAALERILEWTGYDRLTAAERQAIAEGIRAELAAQPPVRRRKRKRAA